MNKKRIGVVGSINTDFSFLGNRIPSPSETVHGELFRVNFGGKGANECVAIARLGGAVSIYGKVGSDHYSQENIANLKNEGVDVSGVGVSSTSCGGTAGIFVDNDTNSIMVVPGANGEVDRTYIDSVYDSLSNCDIVCLQLEIPIDTVRYVVDRLHKSNKVIIFNPSPIVDLEESLYDECDYIIVNEIEIKRMPGYTNNEQMLQKYNGRLILTCGGDGVFLYDGKVVHIPSMHVDNIVDTTGAGDTFLGAFACGLSEGKSLYDSIYFANICAGVKITQAGAQTGMPTIDMVNKFLKSN